ncbi:MAG: DNA polymerase IV [Rhizobiales bacterium]|nr:DNA polymerase IV [Hyphomicrobiales bacterium]
MVSKLDTNNSEAIPNASHKCLCRDCSNLFEPISSQANGQRCPVCASPRVLDHPEITSLSIAHIDCDAFFASVEKRDNPDIRDKPVIIGGGQRGVVAAACYIARTYGIRSAMPIFKAKRACSEAVIIPPDIAKYSRVGREIREMMREVTPLVEPISIDEAFLDLSGTERLHHACAAQTLATLARRIETEVGITVSIGLSHNKFLAKIASDLKKPRGFAMIGKAETTAFLNDKPIGIIWGVGKVTQQKLIKEGVRTIADLRQIDLTTLTAKFGVLGSRLHTLARGKDTRIVNPHQDTKSVSSETTFNTDISKQQELERHLWIQCERTSTRLKAANLSGVTITLKMKTARFQTVTRRTTLKSPTSLADTIFKQAAMLLQRERSGTEYRLIGVGVSGLTEGIRTDPVDFLDPTATRQANLELATDKLRSKFGKNVVGKGRALKR